MTPAKQRVVDKPQGEKVRRGSSITKPPYLYVLGADRLVREDGHFETEAATFLRSIATCVSHLSFFLDHFRIRLPTHNKRWFA